LVQVAYEEIMKKQITRKETSYLIQVAHEGVIEIKEFNRTRKGKSYSVQVAYETVRKGRGYSV